MLDVLKALADPCRLRLVAILLKGEFTVGELTTILGLGQSRISRHLKILADAGVLSVKRQGTWSYYGAPGGSPFFRAIRDGVERELPALPEHSRDLEATAAVLEARRRRSREFFDRHARQWDELARTLLPVPTYVDRLLELVPSGGTVVEAGVGTGGLLPALAGRAGTVIGIDNSTAMLGETRRRLELAGIGGIDLRLGEMTHLPLRDGEAGAVVLGMVLHHAADPAAVLAEVRRVVQPGGCVVIADLCRHNLEWVRERLADQWLGFDGEEIRGWLASSGFERVEVMTVPGAAGEKDVLLARAYVPAAACHSR